MRAFSAACLVTLMATGCVARQVESRHVRARLKGEAERYGIEYPPHRIFLRAFKHERELELWAQGSKGVYQLLGTFPIAAASGDPGPKRKEGDRQVPEGVYFVDRFNPNSLYHRSLGLNYPNAADRVHSDKQRPGSDIFIHGSNVSIGCLAMTDPVIDELFRVARNASRRGKVPVHIFPCRMRGTLYNTLRSRFPAHVSFWKQLEPIYSSFESTRKMPLVKIRAGRYEVAPG